MTRTSKRELLEVVRPRYLRASRTGKGHILDEFVAITGYHRKYAIRLLHHGSPRRPAGRRRVRRTVDPRGQGHHVAGGRVPLPGGGE